MEDEDEARRRRVTAGRGGSSLASSQTSLVALSGAEGLDKVRRETLKKRKTGATDNTEKRRRGEGGKNDGGESWSGRELFFRGVGRESGDESLPSGVRREEAAPSPAASLLLSD